MPRDEDSARNWLYIQLTGALIDPERVSAELDRYRVEVLREAADEAERENAACNAGSDCGPCATRVAVAAKLRRVAEVAP